MIRRNISEEAGARSDGLMIVSLVFIAAFTYIAWTTNPVYTGIGVGDRVPVLEGQVYDGNTWTDFNLENHIDQTWQEGDNYGTWFMIEFMDTNCGYCQQQAAEDIPNEQARWLGDNPPRTTPVDVSVEFLAVSISLWDEDTEGKSYGRTVIEDFRDNNGHIFPYMDMQDNSHRDAWGAFGTPTYFLVAPNGIIEYVNLDAERGYSVWDAMEDNIPRGE